MAGINYSYTETTLMASIREEVAKVAATAFAADGTPLYESVNIFSSDEGVVGSLITDAVNEIVNRMCDICLLSSTSISFNVPDVNSSIAGSVSEALDRYIILSSCASWFRRKYPQVAEEYHAKALAEMTKAVRMLFTRLKPSRTRTIEPEPSKPESSEPEPSEPDQE